MAFIIDNFEANKISITNTDLSNPIEYTIAVLGDSNLFTDITGQVDVTIDEDSSAIVDLVNDGIYRITIASNYYYIVANSNLRACEKTYLQRILCNPCDDCKNDLKLIQANIRFDVLKERFYYIANKYIQQQSNVDLISPENAELLYWKDLLNQLLKICDNCNINGVYTTTSGCGNTDDCGCGCS